MLRSLAMRYKTAIVSGRARLTAHGLVQLDELYYAGSHGFDIAGPRKPHDSDDGTPARRARAAPHARTHAREAADVCMHAPRLQPSAQAATLCPGCTPLCSQASSSSTSRTRPLTRTALRSRPRWPRWRRI